MMLDFPFTYWPSFRQHWHKIVYICLPMGAKQVTVKRNDVKWYFIFSVSNVLKSTLFTDVTISRWKVISLVRFPMSRMHWRVYNGDGLSQHLCQCENAFCHCELRDQTRLFIYAYSITRSHSNARAFMPTHKAFVVRAPWCKFLLVFVHSTSLHKFTVTSYYNACEIRDWNMNAEVLRVPSFPYRLSSHHTHQSNNGWLILILYSEHLVGLIVRFSQKSDA